jgi:uncharacterized protein with HEPN domain
MRHCLCERSNRAAPGHLDAIANIERYATRGREAFESDELIQNWFIRHLQIIGEAARALPQEIRDREQIIPWSRSWACDTFLVHDYFAVDTDVVWDVIERDLPDLKSKVEMILRKVEPHPTI